MAQQRSVRRFAHPVNQTMIEEAPLGVRIAAMVTGFLGSWRFIVIQSVVVAVWLTGNVILLFHFDPYPFILLAGNRSAQREPSLPTRRAAARRR